MTSIGDITPLFQQQVASLDNVGLSFHQGVVQTWDVVEHVNEIRINNTIIPQVPYVGPDDPEIAQGTVVAVLQYGSVYLMLGRIREI